MRILFLYTELAEYTIACLNALKQQAVSVSVVHYPINPEAPFAFNLEGVGSFHDLSGIHSYTELEKLVDDFNPDKIVCSGWINKWYLRICRKWSKRAVCILTMDNHWNGSLKQQLMTIGGKLVLRKWFRKIWVPGSPQKNYALRLGFDESQIMTGFYTCDVDRFEAIGQKALQHKMHTFPKVLLCVARYIPAKGYQELWNAFIKWQETEPNDWELWCAGNGEGYPQRTIHPKIRHLGFIQKEQWPGIIESAGVFILMSHFEPWGVVVQEFAAAGFPLMLTKEVGAGELFLTSGNGWRLESNTPEYLIPVFRKLNQLKTEELLQMAQKSQELARLLTPEGWATRLREA